MLSLSVALYSVALFFQAGAPSVSRASAPKAPGSPAPIIDNERASVWDTSTPRAYPHEYVAIELANGTASFGKMGSTPPDKGRTIVIELKDNTIPALANTSGYPNAFPRPNSKKVLESKRVVVWDYTWTPGVATPMHFHDKDVVVTYLKDGSLKSTTPAGEVVVNDYKFGTVKFNNRNRTHTETLANGSQRAIIVEFK